ncbi:MAG: hypothetical protein SF029_23530 [bacterium]|nr:hypothetical protein [bacterium]
MRPMLEIENFVTFADYFRLAPDIEATLSYFGYSYQARRLDLPRTTQAIEWAADLQTRINEVLPYIGLTSEIARREFLIAPIVAELIRRFQVKVKVEFAVNAGHHLRGTLDYFIQGENNFLIVEAKNAEIQRGFTQLAAELVALDQLADDSTPLLFGAVSIGDIWQFGVLNREQRSFTQDLNLYRVPQDLEDLLRVLVAILQEKNAIRIGIA